MAQPLEPAIPPHLQCPRTQPAKTPKDYAPPFPAYCARFPAEINSLAMAIIGIQSRPGESLQLKHLDPIVRFVKGGGSGSAQSHPPHYWDVTGVRDNRGAHNLAIIAYWPDRAGYDAWAASSGFEAWWGALQPESEHHGWFRELLFPSMDSFETVFSDNLVPEGAARMRASVSGPVQEHVYWGSMRDRMAASQVDALEGQTMAAKNGMAGGSSAGAEKRRIMVPGRKNLCVIRSGQDWSDTTPTERKKYLETMHPVLIRGMDFLRDQGDEVDCFECRFMDVHDEEKSLETSTERTFGLAYFNDMASLEGWAKKHKTHLDIFGRFLQYAAELENNVSLRLFHEVLVLQPDQQVFEYVGCHERTGMLSALDR